MNNKTIKIFKKWSQALQNNFIFEKSFKAYFVLYFSEKNRRPCIIAIRRSLPPLNILSV
jgi:hypothetical protein